MTALNEAAGRGDRAALEALLEHHLPRLRAFVRLRAGAMLRARESCSDLVQSVCREVLTHRRRFRHPDEGAFRRWLFTTAQRKLKNREAYHLAAKRDVLRDLPAGDALGPEDQRLVGDLFRTFSTPSGALAAREEIERLEAAFETLSDGQREIVTLAHVAGLPRAAIAEHVGMSEGAVRVALHRALAKLAAELEEDEERPSRSGAPGRAS